MSAAFQRTRQCKACPWKKSTKPSKDIPGGYCATKHQRLAKCDGSFGSASMACHESPAGSEQACVGWMSWAIRDGNSIRLRLMAADRLIDPRKWKLNGPQHRSLRDMVAAAGEGGEP